MSFIGQSPSGDQTTASGDVPATPAAPQDFNAFPPHMQDAIKNIVNHLGFGRDADPPVPSDQDIASFRADQAALRKKGIVGIVPDVMGGQMNGQPTPPHIMTANAMANSLTPTTPPTTSPPSIFPRVTPPPGSPAGGTPTSDGQAKPDFANLPPAAQNAVKMMMTGGAFPSLMSGKSGGAQAGADVPPVEKTVDPLSSPQNYKAFLEKQIEGSPAILSKDKEEWQAAADALTKDSTTGKAYSMPETVGIQKVIGGKAHSVGDIATLVLGLVAATMGKNGQQFLGGLLQGWVGSKFKAAEDKTQEGREKFNLEQQQRAIEADNHLKKLGFDQSETDRMRAELEKVMQNEATNALRKDTLANTEFNQKTLAQGKAQTQYDNLAKSPNATWSEVESAWKKWNALDPGFAGDHDAVHREWINGPAIKTMNDELSKSYATASKLAGGAVNITPAQEKALSDQRDAMARNRGMSEEDKKVLAPVPKSMETIAAKRLTSLDANRKRTLALATRRAIVAEGMLQVARRNADTNLYRANIGGFTAATNAQDKTIAEYEGVLKKNLDAALAPFKGLTPKSEFEKDGKTETPEGKKLHKAQKEMDDFKQGLNAGPTITDPDTGEEAPNPLYRPKPMPGHLNVRDDKVTATMQGHVDEYLKRHPEQKAKVNTEFEKWKAGQSSMFDKIK